MPPKPPSDNDDPTTNPRSEDRDLLSTVPQAGFDKPPESIGPYRILETIGEGGMGVVYLAEQEKPIRRRVALKVIKLGMDTKEVVGRFEAERQALAMMNHPNIAKVFDAGATDQGRPYFVMEHVPGEPITTYCDKHKLSTKERLKLFMPVCQAIHHAHQKGVIHRDVKPSNVMVMVQDGKPVPKVIDFGVAKAINQRLTEKTVFTEQGRVIGTPAYMSPEQFEMTGLSVDTTSDVYSLGVLFYEILVGVLPFDPKRFREIAWNAIQQVIRDEEPQKPSTRLTSLGDDSSLVAAQRRTEPSILARQLRGDLDWITMRAMDKDRTRRYQSAHEFSADIERHLNGDAVLASPPSVTYRWRKFVRRNTLVVTAVSSVFVALLLGLGFATTMYVKAERAKDNALRQSYRSNIRAALSALDADDVKGVEASLAACPLEFRDIEWHQIQNIIDMGAEVLSGHAGGIFSLAYSPTGDTLASASLDQTIRLWNARTGECLRVLEGHSNWVTYVEFSPDGSRLVSASRDSSVRVWDMKDGSVVQTFKPMCWFPLFARFSLDGKNILSMGPDTTLGVWNIEGGQHIKSFGEVGFQAFASFSPDGKHILTESTMFNIETGDSVASNKGGVWHSFTSSGDLFSAERDSLRVYSPSDSLLISIQIATEEEEASGAFWTDSDMNSDGTLFAVVLGLPNVQVWETVGGTSIFTLRGHHGPTTAVEFSPIDDQLASGSDDGAIRLWDFSTAGDPLTFSTTKGHGFAIDKAERIMIKNDEVWDFQTQTKLTDLDEHTDPVTSVAISDNGHHAFTASEDSTVRMWDTRSGKELAVLRGHKDTVNDVDFDDRSGQLISVSDDSTLIIWDLDTKQPTNSLKAGGRLIAVDSNPGVTVLSVLRRDGLAEVWDFPSDKHFVLGNKATSFKPKGMTDHTGVTWTVGSDPEWALTLSPDSRILATGTPNGILTTWSIENGELLAEMPGHTDGVTSICFSPAGNRVFSGSGDGFIKVWDVVFGELMASFDAGGMVASILFTNNAGLISATYEGDVQYWGNSDGFPKMQLPDLLLRNAADLADAELSNRLYLAAIEALSNLYGSNHPKINTAYAYQGERLEQLSRFHEAESLRTLAHENSLELYGESHPLPIHYLSDLGDHFYGLSEFQKAEDIYARELTLWKNVVGDNSDEVRATLNDLGWTNDQKGRYQDARKYLEESLEVSRNISDDWVITSQMVYLGEILIELREFDSALQLIQESYDLRSRKLYDMTRTLRAMTNLYFAWGKYEKALVSAGEYYSSADYEGETSYGAALQAMALEHLGRLSEAEGKLREVLEINPRHTPYLAQAAALLIQTGKPAEAESLATVAVGEWEDSNKRGALGCAYSLLVLGEAQTSQGKHTEAEPILREALRIREDKIVAGDYRIGIAHCLLGECLVDKGRLSEAESLLLKAEVSLEPYLVGRWSKYRSRCLRQLERLYTLRGMSGRASEYGAKLESPPDN